MISINDLPISTNDRFGCKVKLLTFAVRMVQQGNVICYTIIYRKQEGKSRDRSALQGIVAVIKLKRFHGCCSLLRLSRSTFVRRFPIHVVLKLF